MEDDSEFLQLKLKTYFSKYEYLSNELTETKYMFERYNKQFLKECYKDAEQRNEKLNWLKDELKIP